MALELDRRQRLWVAGVTGYAVAAGGVVTGLLAGGADPVATALLATASVLGLAWLLAARVSRTAATARRLAADTRVLLDVNPAHRLDPVAAGEMYLLAAAVNRLADARQDAEGGLAERVATARRDLEAERNRLAALLAGLALPVVVCAPDGRVLLYNDAARRLVDDETLLGLGRPVFGVVDRSLVAHGLARARRDGRGYTGTTVHRGRLLSVRLTAVQEPGGQDGGFVLVLEDVTETVRATDHREASLVALTERLTEAHDPQQLRRLVADWVRHSAAVPLLPVMTEISADDLAEVVAGTVQEHLGPDADVAVQAPTAPGAGWVRADPHALARLVVRLLAGAGGSAPVTVRVGPGEEDVSPTPGPAGEVTLTVTWTPRAGAAGPGDLPADLPGDWLDDLLDRPAPIAGLTSRALLARHRGRVDGAPGLLRLHLPAVPASSGAPAAGAGVLRSAVATGSRPEFYDFELPAPAPGTDLADRPLTDLTFTVLDTETTGLDPATDRVVAVGAVRVVNGRLLHDEVLERLVDPRRPVPAASTAVHGITTAMVAGQPTLPEVLPDLLRFADGTVLAGHNVGFDLRFLQAAADAAGVRLDLPVLDTLLIDAALHPDHESHTLEAIAERLGVDVVGRHTALGDALVTAEVLVRQFVLLRRSGVTTLGEAIRLSRSTQQARVDRRLNGGGR